MAARVLAAWLLVAALTLPNRVAAQPQFKEFSTRGSFAGTPAPVNLKSAPGARKFRSKLREGAALGPNFAGHFTVVSWGCGTSCQSIAVVDASNGSVAFPEFVSELGQSFQLTSRLFVVNPSSEVETYVDEVGGCGGPNPPTWLATRYYEWNGKRFHLLTETPACAIAQ